MRSQVNEPRSRRRTASPEQVVRMFDAVGATDRQLAAAARIISGGKATLRDLLILEGGGDDSEQ